MRVAGLGTVWVPWARDKKRRPQPRAVGENVAFRGDHLENSAKGFRTLAVYDAHWADRLPSAEKRAEYNEACAAYERAVLAYKQAYEQAAEARRQELERLYGVVVFRNGAFYTLDEEKVRALRAETERLAAERLLREASEAGMYLLDRYLKRLHSQFTRWETPANTRGFRVNGVFARSVYANAYGVIAISADDQLTPVLWGDVHTIDARIVVVGYNPWGYEDKMGQDSRWVRIYPREP